MNTRDAERLERFRRVAAIHGIEAAPSDCISGEEIAHYQKRLNAILYPDAEDWMLPYWAILTLKDSREKHAKTILENGLYRNWSLLGGPGAKHYGLADSRGLITACTTCGSLDFWVSGTEGIIFPALADREGPRFGLVSPQDQIYEWKTDIGPVEFTRIAYHAEKDGISYIFNEIVVRNIGLEDTQARLHVAARPMSQLGFEPIERVQHSQGRLTVNSATALMFTGLPSSVIMGRADDKDLPRKVRIGDGRFDDHFEDAEGLASAVLTFNINLRPAGSDRLFFVTPLDLEKGGPGGSTLEPDESHRDNHVESWFIFSEEQVSATFPEEILDSAFKQSAASLAIQAFSLLLSDEHELCWKDRIRVLLALHQAGCASVVREMTMSLASMLQRDVHSMSSDALVPITWYLLFALANNGMHDDDEFLRSLVIDSVRHIIKETERNAERCQDSPPGEMDEELLQHYFVVGEGVFSRLEGQLWMLSTLQTAQEVLGEWNQTDLLDSVSGAVQNLRTSIKSDINEIKHARWPRTQDSIMDVIDDEILGTLSTVVLPRIDTDESTFFDELAKKIEKRRSVKGLWRSSSSRGLLSSHLLMRLARYYCYARQRNKAERILRRSMEFLSEEYVLPEFVNPRTYGGSGGSGACALAAADLILLLRDMVLREEDGSIALLPGLPLDWFTSKKPLYLEGLPTAFGEASIQIGMSSNQHQIEISALELPEEIEVHVPPSVPISMVKVYGASIVERASGGSSPHLRLVPHSETVVLTFHR